MSKAIRVIDLLNKIANGENVCGVRGGHLRSGYSQSCGCLQKETREKYNSLRHKYKVQSLKKSNLLEESEK